jgi:hypothetical protein
VVAEYAAAGVDRLIVALRPGIDADAVERYVRNNAPERIGADFA